jgi:hypothetical protein
MRRVRGRDSKARSRLARNRACYVNHDGYIDWAHSPTLASMQRLPAGSNESKREFTFCLIARPGNWIVALALDLLRSPPFLFPHLAPFIRDRIRGHDTHEIKYSWTRPAFTLTLTRGPPAPSARTW